MAQAALRPSKSLGKLLRFKRKRAGLTLREVGERLESLGEPLPTSTLSHIEQGKLDPGSRRLHLLLRLFRIPSETVSDLIDLETRGIELPEPTDLETMLAGARSAWSGDDPHEGLAWFIALQHLCVDADSDPARTQSAVLSFAEGLLDRGRVESARRILDQLLAEGPHPEVRARTYVFAGRVWRHTGNLEVAAAFLQRAEEATPSGDREARAWTLHQRALLETAAGRYEAAEASLEESLRLYARTERRRGETAARVLRARNLRVAGRTDEAIRLARATARLARKHRLAAEEAAERVELGRALVAAGRAADALDQRHEALADAMRDNLGAETFDAHAALWRAYLALGDRDRARLELEKASLHAGPVDPSNPDLADVRAALARPADARASEPGSASASGSGPGPGSRREA